MTSNVLSLSEYSTCPFKKGVYCFIILLDVNPSVFKVDSFLFLSGVLFVTKGTFGQLTCEWQYSFDEFTKEPFIVHERRLRIEAKVC